MMIVTATNVTHARCKPGKCGEKVLARKDGTADYDVWVGINHHRIWGGTVEGHVRDAGAPALLRLIADKIESAQQMEAAMPILTRMLHDAAMAEPSEILLEECRQRLFAVLHTVHKQKGRTLEASLRRKLKPVVRQIKLKYDAAEGCGTK